MKVLAVSNMYPSEQKPYSGLFVVNQINEIKGQISNKDALDFYYMKRSFTGKIGSFWKYIKFFIGFLPFILSRKKYDIIHIHYFYPTVYLGLFYKLFYRNAKIVVTFHGGDYYKAPKNLLFSFPFKYLDGIIAVSKNLGEAIRPYFAGNIKIIPAGINSVFKAPCDSNDTEKIYDLIYVGSFYQVKGFDKFCEALSRYSNKLKVCIIGSGELEHLVENSRKNHIIDLFKNLDQSEILQKLYKSKYLINTSRKESFGLSMTEAMACGVPVIATATDGAFEQIINESNGFLIKNNDSDQIIDTINKALSVEEKTYSRFSNNALESSKKYKLPEIATQVREIYEDIFN